jgi:hypothetical protein
MVSAFDSEGSRGLKLNKNRSVFGSDTPKAFDSGVLKTG